MNLKRIFLCTWLLLPCLASAQTFTQAVKGTVTDLNTGQPLPGATVVVLGITPLLGASTDENGDFRIASVPVGRQTLQIRMVGYSAQTKADILVSSGKQTEVSFGMTEELNTTSEVEITDKKNLAKSTDETNLISARTFSPEEMRRYAGSVNDPARMVTAFPGVQGDPSGNNDIIVRGNSPRGILWKLEGMEMPNPNHFSSEGSTGGAISALNPNVLRSSDFLTGAFGAQYGNATSGIFDLGLRKGNTEKTEFTAQIGTLGMELQSEGPLNKKGKQAGSYVANYRYSTLDVLNAAGIKVSGEAQPAFQDGVFKIWLPTAKAGTFTVYGMGGYNTLKDLSRDQNEQVRERFTGAQARWTTGVKHYIPLSDKLSLESQINNSGTYSNNNQTGNPYSPEDAFIQTYREQNTYLNYRLASTLFGKINAQHTFRAGIISSLQGFSIKTDQYNFERKVIENNYNQNGSTNLFQSFISWQYRPSTTVTLNGGLHYTRFALNRQSVVEPRITASWQAARRHTFSVGAGLHSRVDPVSLYYSRVLQADDAYTQPNKNLGINRSLHLVGSHLFALSDGFNIKTEAYYQHLFQVPIGVDSNSYASIINASDLYVDQRLVNKGKGRNYGVDFGLEKTFTGNWYFSATQSLFRSEYKNPNYAWKSSRYDNRFVTNILGGKEFSLKSRKNRQRTLITNFRVIYTGGINYTPVDVAKSQEQNQSVYDNTQYNAKRAPSFVRFDLSIGLRTNRTHSTHTLKLDAFNAFNQLATLGEYYDIYEKKVAKPYSLGIVPNLSYRIEF